MTHIGIYEYQGWRTTKKEHRHLGKRALKRQPFLHVIDIVLLRNTRRVRKIITKYRGNR